MIKILSFILAVFLIFTSCSSNDENITNSKVRETFKAYNINPSEIEKITYVEVINYNGNKLAIGQKNGNAWLAKFDGNGNEVYSKEYSFSWNGIEKSYFQSSTTCTNMTDAPNEYSKSDCNILFIYANIDDYIFNDDYLKSNVLSDNASFLAINVDDGDAIFKSDVTTKRSDSEFHNYVYGIYPSNGSYIIEVLERNVEFKRFISLSQKGVLWDRETLEHEKKEGIHSYPQFLLIDSEKIFFKALNDLKCKVFNLNNSFFEKEFESNEMPIIGDHTGDNYSCGNVNYHIKNNIIYCEYDEIEKIIKVNEITGTIETTYKTINTFHYKIDTNNYIVSERKKK